MRVLKTAFRFSSLLKPTLAVVKPKFNPYTLAATSLATGVALWFGSQKVLAQEVNTYEVEDNLQQGEVVKIPIGPKPENYVILMKYKGEYYCTQSKCSHYGYPLNLGILVGDKITCRFHNAAFDIKTGAPEQGPVLDGIRTFPVQVKNGKVIVSVPKVGWENVPQRPPFGAENVDKSKRIVIVGAGPAAISAAQTLRQTGYNGQIIMISKQKELPYDRTLLSKVMGKSKIPEPLRSADYLQQNGITFVGQNPVVGVDYKNKSVKLKSRDTLYYDKLLIATGSVNRFPPIKGLKQTQFHSLRGLDDFQKINAALNDQKTKNVTIIGAGLIGMELASAFKLAHKEKINITIVDQSKAPLQNIIGPEVGGLLRRQAQKHGVNIITSASINRIQSKNGKPEAVVLADRSLQTDMLVVATGAMPAVEFVKQLTDPQDHGIRTNAFLQTSEKDVYAAGDIASYPYWYTGKYIRNQHINQAFYQGSVAGLNMAGRRFPMDNVPFFWTKQYNKYLYITGAIQGWDQVYITGDVDKLEFTAYYIDKKNDKVLGTAIMGLNNMTQLVNQAIRYGVMPKASEVKAGKVNFNDLLKKVQETNPKCSKCGRIQEKA